MPWFVIYTKSRSEKLAAAELRQRGIDVYCPVRKVKRKWSDRMKLVEEPLFNSYCFVHLEEKERHLVYGVPGVVGYLFWLKKPAVVKQKEIDIIKNMLNDFDHDSISLIDFKQADRLRITSGAFTGREGEVISSQGKSVIIRVESLQICISIDASKNKIEKINRPDSL